MNFSSIKHFEIHGFYWLMKKDILIDSIYNKASKYKYSRELSQLSKGYFATNSIYPKLSTQRVLDFILEYHNEESK